jgi:serine/threonine-protein phosphatase CPPED1
MWTIRLLWLSLVGAGNLFAQGFFVQGADPQFGMYAKDQNFLQETANFEFFVANVNRLRPMFVIICGDLTNAHTPEQIAEYQRIAATLSPAIKLYNVAGNHDVGNEPTPLSLANYRKNYGADWYSFQAEGIYGIVLDSSIIGSPAKVPEEAASQEQWLRTELKKAKSSGARIIVFQHIPWFLSAPDEPDQYFNIPKAVRTKYLSLLADYGVKDIFAGHYHRNAQATTVNFNMVVTGPIGMPLGPDDSGFRIVTVTGHGLEQKYYPLGRIPNFFPPPPVH